MQNIRVLAGRDSWGNSRMESSACTGQGWVPGGGTGTGTGQCHRALCLALKQESPPGIGEFSLHAGSTAKEPWSPRAAGTLPSWGCAATWGSSRGPALSHQALAPGQSQLLTGTSLVASGVKLFCCRCNKKIECLGWQGTGFPLILPEIRAGAVLRGSEDVQE